MDIGQKQIAGIMARAKMGRPRVGSWRCGAMIPDHITDGIDDYRRLTNLSRNEAMIALIDAGLRSQTCHTAIVDRQGAIALLRSSVKARLAATDDQNDRKVACNTLLALDWIEEYLGACNHSAPEVHNATCPEKPADIVGDALK